MTNLPLTNSGKEKWILEIEVKKYFKTYLMAERLYQDILSGRKPGKNPSISKPKGKKSYLLTYFYESR